MATGSTRQVVRQLRQFALRETDSLTDGQLLECFVGQRDEAAFAALVRRHGPMVWGVCRRIVGHAEDAEDAFQAAFLVLARKAATVRPRELVGHWLYGVAHRTALKAKAVAARRRERERQVPFMPPAEVSAPTEVDWLPLLDRELGRLPEKYRIPIILCDLEGRTRREVARQLRLPDGTLSNRLASGRRMLARRLARHGVTLSAGALAAALVADASAGVPSPLLVAAVRAVAEDIAPGAASAAALTLSDGVIKAMLLKRLKVTTVILILLGLFGLGASVLSESRADPPSKAGAAAGQPETDVERIQGAWVQLAVAADGGWLATPEEIKREGKRWTFHGDKFLVTRASEPGVVTEVSFQLNETSSPKHIDYTVVSGDNKGQKSAGIYRLDDEFLIVRDDRASSPRPAALRGEPHGNGRIAVFGREGAPAKGADPEFLKRICQELRGDTPTALEAHYFKADADPLKRAKVISWVLGGVPHDSDLRYLWTYLSATNDVTTQMSLLGYSNLLNVNPNLNQRWAAGITLQPNDTLYLDLGFPNALQSNNTLYLPMVQGLQGLNGPMLVDPLNANRYLIAQQPSANHDIEWLRRLSLDLIGALPTPLETRYFLADQDPKKRDRIVEWLVKTDAYARHTTKRGTESRAATGGDRLAQLLDRLLADKKSDAVVLEALSLAALARYPTETEKSLIAAQVAKQLDRRAAWDEVLATLLHTSEAQQHIDELTRRRAAK